MRKKMTVNTIKKSKNRQPLVMITAYDALFANLFQESADIILIGDSLNMSFAGKKDTLSTTLEQMIYHTNAVCHGAPDTFSICDMPFGTYTSQATALSNAVRIFQETPTDSVKIEGGSDKAHIIEHLVNNGIAVCGHIGLLPQSVRGEGGYLVKGKDDAGQAQLLHDAKAVEAAGAFCMVIEGVKADVATHIASNVTIPVIGIGAGAKVDRVAEGKSVAEIFTQHRRGDAAVGFPGVADLTSQFRITLTLLPVHFVGPGAGFEISLKKTIESRVQLCDSFLIYKLVHNHKTIVPKPFDLFICQGKTHSAARSIPMRRQPFSVREL